MTGDELLSQVRNRSPYSIMYERWQIGCSCKSNFPFIPDFGKARLQLGSNQILDPDCL
jgi:hypothetical protein